jgi:hypothetical protein
MLLEQQLFTKGYKPGEKDSLRDCLADIISCVCRKERGAIKFNYQLQAKGIVLFGTLQDGEDT